MVTTNDNWVQRLKDLGSHRDLEDVRITGRYERMTSTQACRYEELKALRRRPAPPVVAADQSYYTLAEASERLSVPLERLLRSAADGDLRCFIRVAGLRGRWRPGPPRDEAAGAAWLALPEAACRDVASYGSANVAVLEYLRDGRREAEFALDDVLWVDPSRLALMHPLPAA